MVPAYVMITVRDSWSNVLRSTNYAYVRRFGQVLMPPYLFITSTTVVT